MSQACADPKPIVAVARDYFCHVSEGFVYRHVVGLKRYHAVVLARRRINADIFPYQDVVLGEPSDSPLARALYRVVGSASNRLGRPHLHVNRRFAAFVRGRRPVVIHAHFGWSAVEVMDLAKGHGIPLVFTAHGSDVNSLSSGGRRYAQRLARCFHVASRALCVSEFIANRVRELGCPEHKIRVLRVGVPIPPLPEPQAEGPPRFIAVGRLVPVKGPLFTLEAFRIVHQQMPEARLCLIGDGPLMEKARAFVREQGLDEAVRLLGQVPHERVYQELARSDIFVQHSLRTEDGQEEGFSLTFAEAAAHGLPGVGTTSGGTPEAVLDGATGFLVAERDVAAMAERMLALARDAGLRLRMGQAARAYAVQSLDLDKQNAKIEDLYDEVRASG